MIIELGDVLIGMLHIIVGFLSNATFILLVIKLVPMQTQWNDCKLTQQLTDVSVLLVLLSSDVSVKLPNPISDKHVDAVDILKLAA